MSEEISDKTIEKIREGLNEQGYAQLAFEEMSKHCQMAYTIRYSRKPNTKMFQLITILQRFHGFETPQKMIDHLITKEFEKIFIGETK